MKTHQPWDVREPAQIIDDALRRRRPRPGDVLVALVQSGDEPDQALVDVARVHRGERPGRYEASDLLRAQAEAMVGERPFVDGRWMPPRHVLVTVVCRSGRVVPGPEELFWLLAWRYSNHLTAAFNGDLYLVTEHGWTGCADKRAGSARAEASVKAPRRPPARRPGAVMDAGHDRYRPSPFRAEPLVAPARTSR